MFEFVDNLTAKAKAIGVGGAGGNVINALVRTGISGVECISANTDQAALSTSLAPRKIQLGAELTRGLGAGADPDIGRRAALESKEALKERLAGADVVFIFAGLGGGTGTGGAPIVADIARDSGAFVVGVVTLPFEHEGKVRKEQAQQGLVEMREAVDTFLVVKNQRLLDMSNGKLFILDAFQKINDVIYDTVQGLADLINLPGLINVDFADVRKILANKGNALIRSGRAKGQNRVLDAINGALSSEIFDENSIEGARGVLLNITGSSEMEMSEVERALVFIRERAHEDADIIMGALIDENLADEFRITLIAADFDVAPKTAYKRKTFGEVLSPPLTPPLRPRTTLFGDEDLSIPAYIRRSEHSRVVKVGIISDDGECLQYDGANQTAL